MREGKKHLMWFMEAVIWLSILVAIAGGIIFARYIYKKDFNTYQIFLSDVDGLINGSPVRLMGIQVGYISQINIVGDDVYVKFIITDKNVNIGKGTIATVEFTGLGGSKSLELYPPTELTANSDKLIVVESPKRIHDSLGLLNDMFDKVSSIAYRFSYFFKQTEVIKPKEDVLKPESVKKSGETLRETDKWLDRRNKDTNELGKKLKEWNHE